MTTHYLAENALQRLAPDLHSRYTGCMGIADGLLGRYMSIFPEFTDHSLLHSIEVTNLCNYLISNRIDGLCAEELYILLMACLLHDVGMGYSEEELAKLAARRLHPEMSAQELIRAYHHDYSAHFIREYWRDCYISNEQMADVIAEVGRGHRKTDLMDRSLYPDQLPLHDGKATVNMAYLAAVLRLADELDISASRNLMLEYTGFIPSNDKDAMEFQKHRSLRSVLTDDHFILQAETNVMKEYMQLLDIHKKLEETLNYCQHIASSCAGVSLPVRVIVNEIKYTGDNSQLLWEDDRSEGLLTVKLSGRLDTMTAPMLDELLANSLGGAIINLTLDFSSLQYVSSAGLRVILGAKKKTAAMQGKLTIRQIPPEVMAVFKTTGFDSVLELSEQEKL